MTKLASLELQKLKILPGIYFFLDLGVQSCEKIVWREDNW